MKRKWKYYLVLWSVILSGFNNPGFSNISASNLRFQYLTTDDGLAQNTVDCIFKDSNGFMWFGTWNGLCQYDGYSFKTYQKGDQKNGLPNNFVRSVTEDRFGNLWVGTADGLTVFNLNKERFSVQENVQQASQNLSVNTLKPDSAGNIWMGTEQGNLFLFIPENTVDSCPTWSVKKINTGVLQGHSINDVCCLNDGTVIIGTAFGIFGIENNKLVRFSLGDLASFIPESLNVRCVFETKSGDLYFGTEAGLYVIRQHMQNYLTSEAGDYQTISHATVMSVAEEYGGTILVGTLGGLDFLNPSTMKVDRIHGREDEHSKLNNEFINSVYADDDGNVWIGTDKGGINRFSIYQKSFYSMKNHPDDGNSLSNNTINSILSDGSRLWVGTAGGGLNLIDRNSGHITRFLGSVQNRTGLTSNFISSLTLDQQKQLWIGTWGGGLNKLESVSCKAFLALQNVPGNRRSLASDFVSSVYPDERGFLVIGMRGGLDLYNPDRNLLLHFHEMLELNDEPPEVGCILKDSHGYFWFGTRKGLIRVPARLVNFSGEKLEASDFEFFTHDEKNSFSLPGDYIISLMEDKKGNVWVGTYGNGICTAVVGPDRRVTFRSFTQKDGLCNNVIYTMENDLDGNIWISTDKGLSRFNPEQKTFENFYTKDGLLSDQFYWSASESDSSGALYFGGVNGLNYFNPREITTYQGEPKVVFTDFRVFNHSVAIGEKLHGRVVLENSVSKTKTIELSYRDNVFSIEFSALEYFLPDKVIYQYKLVGVDQNWVTVPATRRFANYTNLSGGRYLFQVKAANSDGVISDQVSEVEINIHPPFWETVWFRFVLVLAIIGSVMGYIRYRTYRLHQQKRKLEQQVHDRTLQIEAQKEQLEAQFETLRKSNNELANRQVLIEGQKVELEKQNQLIAEQRDEVIELNQKVSQINQLRLRFFTNISHEFRTPLTLILDPLETLMKKMEADSSVIQTLKLINRNAQRLLHLINQLMYFRRIETGAKDLHVSRGDLKLFLFQIYESFLDLAQHQGINYLFEEGKVDGETWFDAEKLENIFYNLLSNAFKYTPESGSIYLKVHFVGQSGQSDIEVPYVCVEVIDSGMGIEQEHLPYIFERFYQVRSEKNSGMKSSGIGLALAYELVHALHGRIDVKSEVGKGSHFIIRLPYTKDRFDERELDQSLVQAAANLQGRVDVLTESITHEGNFEDPDENDEDKSKSKPLVLIVEDNFDMRSFLIQTLRSEYRLLGAENGKEGLALAKKYSPDLILSDLMMPIMDGVELCSRLKKDVQTSHIPVILLTAQNMIENWIKGLESGADDYIPKPFNLEVLQARITNLIEGRRRLQKKFSNPHDALPDELTSNPIDGEFMLKACAVLEKSYQNPEFSASQFASEMFVSRSLLYKKIRAITDLNITDFINSFKLKKAVELIQENKLPMADIAFNVGFNDPKYFSRIFRKFYGMSPSEFQSK